MATTLSSETLARRIVEKLQSAGHTAYFAGGCVRDRLMGRVPADYDVATSARPDQVLALFPKSQQVGVAFGVVLVREQRRTAAATVEVATFRTEGVYSDGRHPDTVAFATAEEDAQRRDFTCNGLFFDPIADKLLDFVGGQADIQGKTLRAIRDPAQRFAEDHLRMLRAVRFAAKLSFTIEPATRQAIIDHQARIALISRERIGEEIRMMLAPPVAASIAPGPSSIPAPRAAAMTLLSAFPIMFGEIFAVAPSIPNARWPRLEALPPAINRPVALLAMLQDLEVPQPADMVDPLRSHLMLSNDETEKLAWLIRELPVLINWRSLTRAPLKRLAAHACWPDLESLYRADPAHAAQLPEFAGRLAALRAEGVAPPPFVTGNDLIGLGAAPSPRFKAWLDELYNRQLELEFPTRAAALLAARALFTAAKPR